MIPTSRRGFTLIEIMIAYTLLAALIGFVMITILATSRPITDTTQRSFMVSQGNAGMSLLTRELVAGFPDIGTGGPPYTFCLGDTYDEATQAFTINADTAPGPSALHDYNASAGGREIHYGRSIRFLPVTGFSANDYINDTNLSGPVTGTEVVFAFVPDEVVNNVDDDRDGLVDELKLVRGEGSLVVDVLKDIPRGADGVVGATSAGDVVPEAPYFEIQTPADLRIVFQMRRRVDHDESRTDVGTTLENDKDIFVQVEFAKKVNMRNANQ